jgi:isocitrate/isopropylmalate dehydrogenase
VGEEAAGDRVEAAVADVIADGTAVTPDLRAEGDDRPPATTEAVGGAVAARL